MSQRRYPFSSSVAIKERASAETRTRDLSASDNYSVPVAPTDPAYAVAKRALDITLSLALLVALWWLFVLIAILVKATSRGPVIYRQYRIGRGGRAFRFFKFRSMVDGADAQLDEVAGLNTTGGPTFKHPEDPRITSVGRFLRRTSLDELPQLVNVLRGDMSLVGPRPPLGREVAEYNARDMGRLAVQPGITCLWQVNGRSHLGFADQVDLDLEYVNRRSLALDLYILLQTVPAVLTGRGAC